MFSQKLKGQSGILKQKTTLYGISFKENSLIALTGCYDRIFNKTIRKEVIIVEIIIGCGGKVNLIYVDINIFKNAPALQKLL